MTASHPETPAVASPPRQKGRASGRAGRNLVAAIGVGVALGGAVLASLLIERHWFVAVVAVAAAVGTWELAGALRRGADIRVPLPVLLVGGQAMIWLAWPFGLAAVASRSRPRRSCAAVADARRVPSTTSATSPRVSSRPPTSRCSARSPR